MGNLISFMKEVADGLRESGNYGTAHIYRSPCLHSMGVIIFLFGKLLRSILKVSNRICGGKIVAGIQFLPICVRCVQCITVRSTAVLRLIFLIISGMSIQERVRTESGAG